MCLLERIQQQLFDFLSSFLSFQKRNLLTKSTQGMMDYRLFRSSYSGNYLSFLKCALDVVCLEVKKISNNLLALARSYFTAHAFGRKSFIEIAVYNLTNFAHVHKAESAIASMCNVDHQKLSYVNVLRSVSMYQLL